MDLNDLNLERQAPWLVTWGFEGEDFDLLRTYADVVHYPERATIFSIGDTADAMYLVLEGIILVFDRDAQGQEHLFGIVTAGQSFGELGVLVGRPRVATCTAGTDARLLKITPDTLAALEKDRPRLMLKLYKKLAQTLADQWVHGGLRPGKLTKGD